ncbi:histidinol-phosphatase [Alteromonas ponticola]|uniref:protein-tyrosine-phosphatase n=1 Tax=Alteromonas aquimaris TaxID=2998417 RepID=A0ABT3PAE7_9ALTE|nr:CpsB/CapC family capsule biosynthesis tyrosine phosphatase [Alteromonas aquimaris]MCW8109500.1 histidinol-phosphatase [Alteromonas aquimaris]
MIDVHSHIIPGIDDGARDMEMSLAMARQTVQAGVTHLVCTPHIHWGYFNNTKDIIHSGFIQLEQELAKAGIALSLSFAGEVRVNEMIPLWLHEDKLPFIGQWNERNVLLLEMPHSHVPGGLDQLVRWLLSENVQPLIPHPERNRDILNSPEKIQWLRNLGCLVQVTAGALTGRFGERVENLAFKMLDNNQIDLVASDTHDTTRRPNEMGEARRLVKQHLGEDIAQRLFCDTPAAIVFSH